MAAETPEATSREQAAGKPALNVTA
jgi:hypothetical protein